MARSSVKVTFIARYSILMTGLLCIWICEIDIVMLFLILTLDTTRDVEKLDNTLSIKISRFWMWFLTFFPCGWKEILSKNESIKRFPGENSWLKESNEGINSFFLLSMSIRELFKRLLCLNISVLRDKLCRVWSDDSSGERFDLIMWLQKRE